MSFRLGLWGIGPHARKNLLPALRCTDTVTLAGITTRDQRVGRDVASQHDCEYWPAPEAMLASEAIDGVYLATPIGLHHEQALAAFAHGKHVWCEKSLTATLAQAQELATAARRHQLSLCEGFMYAFHPQFHALKAAIADDPGPISVTCRFGMPALAAPGFRSSAQLGGGALLDVGCYPISLALHLLGPKVAIELARVETGDEVDSTGLAVLRSARGTAQLEWGFGRAYCNEVTVWGAARSLYAERIFSKPADQAVRLVCRDERGTPSERIFPPADHFVSMFEYFAAAASSERLREALIAQAEAQAQAMAAVRRAAHSAAHPDDTRD